MIYKVYSVYDSKVGAYLPPMFVPTRGKMLQMFSDALADKSHMFAKHPEDFVLFELGEFDDSIGRFVILDANENLGNGVDYISK